MCRNNYSISLAYAPLLALALLLAGCSNPAVNVSEIFNHHQCQSLRSGFVQVGLTELPQIRGVRLLAPPSDEAPASPPTSSGSDDADDADVLLFAISRGSQPTPGYGFELTEARSNGDEVELRYVWQVPPPDAVLAQVITSPCSVVQLSPASAVTAVSAWLDDDLVGRIELGR